LRGAKQRNYGRYFSVAKTPKLHENNFSTLSELRDKVSAMQKQVVHAKQNHKDCDVRLKRRSCDSEWDKLISERRKAYNKYSDLKRAAFEAEKICCTAEMIMQEGNMPQKNPRNRDMER